MIQLTITLHTEDDIMAQHKKDALMAVLTEAEENGELDFAFSVQETANTED